MQRTGPNAGRGGQLTPTAGAFLDMDSRAQTSPFLKSPPSYSIAAQWQGAATTYQGRRWRIWYLTDSNASLFNSAISWGILF